jgi:hypothetical protein
MCRFPQEWAVCGYRHAAQLLNSASTNPCKRVDIGAQKAWLPLTKSVSAQSPSVSAQCGFIWINKISAHSVTQVNP